MEIRKESDTTERLNSTEYLNTSRVPSLGREDLLEKEMATHSSILAWEIPWAEKPEGTTVQSMGLQRSQTRVSD